jgi:hypothetical protein
MTDNYSSPEFNESSEEMCYLLDETTFIVAEGFEQMRLNTNRAYAQYVQINTSIIPGMALYSVLLSSAGVKADEAVHLVRVLAYPLSGGAAIDPTQAANEIYEGNELPFRTDKYLIEHIRPQEVGKSIIELHEISENGISELFLGDRLEQKLLEITNLDFEEFLGGLATTPVGTWAADSSLHESFSEDDLEYIKELRGIFSDNNGWPIIPQN